MDKKTVVERAVVEKKQPEIPQVGRLVAVKHS
jgi:hypothetical protein